MKESKLYQTWTYEKKQNSKTQDLMKLNIGSSS